MYHERTAILSLALCSSIVYITDDQETTTIQWNKLKAFAFSHTVRLYFSFSLPLSHRHELKWNRVDANERWWDEIVDSYDFESQIITKAIAIAATLHAHYHHCVQFNFFETNINAILASAACLPIRQILCDVHAFIVHTRVCRPILQPFRQPEHMYYNHGTHAWARACILAANITSIESFVYRSHLVLNSCFRSIESLRFFSSDLSGRMTQHAYAHFLLVFLFLLCVIKDTILLFIKYLVTMSAMPKALSCMDAYDGSNVNASHWIQCVAKWIENLSTFCARSGKFVC